MKKEILFKKDHVESYMKKSSLKFHQDLTFSQQKVKLLNL